MPSSPSPQIRHWKTPAYRDGRPVTLYTSTSEKIIETDLALGYSGSLTFAGRKANRRRVPTPADNHIDFATGAFSQANRHGVTPCARPPEPVTILPAHAMPLARLARLSPQTQENGVILYEEPG